MSSQKLKAAILVVSTTAASDPSKDTSAGILKNVFETEGNEQWEVIDTKIVGDVVLDIQKTLMGWTDSVDGLNLIVTTGGTGFAVYDVTPEVCRSPAQRDHVLIRTQGCNSYIAQASKWSRPGYDGCFFGCHAM